MRRVWVESKRARNARPLETTMLKTDRPEPNAELTRSFEPLRVVFALSALLLGVPARLAGWMCACGVRLDAPASGFADTIACQECGKAYRFEGGGVRQA